MPPGSSDHPSLLGRAWTSDYGDPHNPHDFDFIYPISPLHNIPTDKVLPPFMLVTADRTSILLRLSSVACLSALTTTRRHRTHR